MIFRLWRKDEELEIKESLLIEAETSDEAISIARSKIVYIKGVSKKDYFVKEE